MLYGIYKCRKCAAKPLVLSWGSLSSFVLVAFPISRWNPNIEMGISRNPKNPEGIPTKRSVNPESSSIIYFKLLDQMLHLFHADDWFSLFRWCISLARWFNLSNQMIYLQPYYLSSSTRLFIFFNQVLHLLQPDDFSTKWLIFQRGNLWILNML